MIDMYEFIIVGTNYVFLRGLVSDSTRTLRLLSIVFFSFISRYFLSSIPFLLEGFEFQLSF